MSRAAHIDPATARVLAMIDDEELDARYPNRSHFISAGHPEQEKMTTRALAEGDPVVIVDEEGPDLLIRP